MKRKYTIQKRRTAGYIREKRVDITESDHSTMKTKHQNRKRIKKSETQEQKIHTDDDDQKTLVEPEFCPLGGGDSQFSILGHCPARVALSKTDVC